MKQTALVPVTITYEPIQSAIDSVLDVARFMLLVFYLMALVQHIQEEATKYGTTQ